MQVEVDKTRLSITLKNTTIDDKVWILGQYNYWSESVITWLLHHATALELNRSQEKIDEILAFMTEAIHQAKYFANELLG